LTFLLFNKKPDEETASISFSGSQLKRFGFNTGCKVAVSLSKGEIVISVLEDTSSKESDNDLNEGI
jgi:formylmethanofuran dehydrogenase subunit D